MWSAAGAPTLEHGQRHQQVGEHGEEEVDDVSVAAPAHIHQLQHRVRLGCLVLELVCHHCMSRACAAQDPLHDPSKCFMWSLSAALALRMTMLL